MTLELALAVHPPASTLLITSVITLALPAVPITGLAVGVVTEATEGVDPAGAVQIACIARKKFMARAFSSVAPPTVALILHNIITPLELRNR